MREVRDWGLDPGVQSTRRIFARMEEGERGLLEQLGVSPLDPRLRQWRDEARTRFERLWAREMGSAQRSGHQDAGDLYVHCLREVLSADGIRLPSPAPAREDGEPLIRLRLFGRCRIYHDPVSPVLQAPAQIGWSAWFREIDLVTPRRLKGRELLMRTQGWWTADPTEVGEVVEGLGRLVVGDQGDLVVELPDQDTARDLARLLAARFGDQVLLSP